MSTFTVPCVREEDDGVTCDGVWEFRRTGRDIEWTGRRTCDPWHPATGVVVFCTLLDASRVPDHQHAPAA